MAVSVAASRPEVSPTASPGMSPAPGCGSPRVEATSPSRSPSNVAHTPRGGGARSTSFASEEQLLSIIDEAAENELIEEDDRELIHSVFDFTDRYVREVMVPRTDMVTVDAAATTREALALFLDKGVSRVPLADDEADADGRGHKIAEAAHSLRPCC